MFKTFTKWAIFFYSLTVITLGAIGYFQGHSTASLIAGSGLGTLLLLSCLFMFMGYKGGSYAALTLTLLLTGAFAYRSTVTTNLLPALMAVLSCSMLVFLLVQLAAWKRI
jgi:uncharacterized membrane protein (UPF0136 family)